MDKKRKLSALNEQQIGQLMETMADYQEFIGEETGESAELSYEDLDIVSAAGTIPSFQSLLRKIKEQQ